MKYTIVARPDKGDYLLVEVEGNKEVGRFFDEDLANDIAKTMNNK